MDSLKNTHLEDPLKDEISAPKNTPLNALEEENVRLNSLVNNGKTQLDIYMKTVQTLKVKVQADKLKLLASLFPQTRPVDAYTEGYASTYAHFSQQLTRANADFEKHFGKSLDSLSADDTFDEFLESQHKNALDVTRFKKKLREITKKNLEYFSDTGHIEIQGCTDGRKISEVVLGMSAIVKTAAGKIDIMSDEKHRKRVLRQVEKLSKKNLETTGDPTVRYTKLILSHTHCAAAASCATCIHDNGLMEDIENKIQLRKDKNEIVRQFSQENNIPLELSIFLITYDIKDGSMNIGMENKENLDIAKQKDGYSEELINTLEKEQKVISTRTIVDTNKDGLRDVFVEICKKWGNEKFSFEDNYVSSMDKFADALLELKDLRLANGKTPLGSIMEAIENSYGAPHTEGPNKHNRVAKILLRNAFSYFLFNYSLDGKKHGNYPYKEHREPLILIHDGVTVPHHNNPFILSQYNKPNPDYLLFLSNIIFDNRTKRKTILDSKKLYDGNQEDFGRSPINVPIFRYTKSNIPLGIVEKLNQLSTSFKDENGQVQDLGQMAPHKDKNGKTMEAPLWYRMSDENFRSYLASKCEAIRTIFKEFPPELSDDLIRQMNKLRHISMNFYKNPALREQILSGKIRLRPCITNKNGLPLIYLPFQEAIRQTKTPSIV